MSVPFSEWAFATFLGFRSNGCSFSPDTMYLRRIGAGTNHWPPAPCDLHDYRYWRGGNEEDRLIADIELYAGLCAVAVSLPWPFSIFARKRAHAYYIAVRTQGASHFNRSQS